MNYRSHRVAGICLGLLSGALITNAQLDTLSLSQITIITTTSYLGSTMPDIDEPNSYIGKTVKPLSKAIKKTMGHRGAFHSPFVLSLICFCLWITSLYIPDTDLNYSIVKLLLIFSIVSIEVKRSRFKRCISLGVVGLMGLLVIGLDPTTIPLIELLRLSILGISIGMGSHLLMDSLTVGGVPWLWPFTKKKFHFLNLKTNEHEQVAQFLFLLPTLCSLYIMYKPYIDQLIINK